VLHILLRVIEGHLRRSSGASAHACFGAVSFIHRFGASLNRHVHYHCCVIDGVFEPARDDGDAVHFRPAALTTDALAAIAEQVRVRVLRWFARHGLIEPDDVRLIPGCRGACRGARSRRAGAAAALHALRHSMSASWSTAADGGGRSNVPSWPNPDVPRDHGGRPRASY
jgi:hypothetical protein